MVHKDIEELTKVYNQRYQSAAGRGMNKREVRLYRKYYDLLDLKLPVGFSYLDIGCGAGDKTFAFSRDAASALGIDLAVSGIEALSNRYQADKKMRFEVRNILEYKERFHLVTALGFSLLNEKNLDRYHEVALGLIENNLIDQPGCSLVIGSFTDFSGKNETSWYYHRRQELDEIMQRIRKSTGLKVRILFPHQKWRNYFGYGPYNFLAECYKRIRFRRKNYFIVISYE